MLRNKKMRWKQNQRIIYYWKIISQTDAKFSHSSVHHSFTSCSWHKISVTELLNTFTTMHTSQKYCKPTFFVPQKYISCEHWSALRKTYDTTGQASHIPPQKRWCNFWLTHLAQGKLHPHLLGKSINLLKPTGHMMHQQFNIQQLYILPTLYLCVLYLSENKQRLVPLTA